jgi:hypothetical protein
LNHFKEKTIMKDYKGSNNVRKYLKVLPVLLPLVFGIGLWKLKEQRFSTSQEILLEHHNRMPKIGRAESGISRSGSETRRVYPYSIIPGGIFSVDDLKKAVLRDQIVASHFSSFDLRKARIAKLTHTKMVHVAYRMNGKTYWTKKKVRLAKGEEIITDGVNFARTRCGNRISETAQEPIHSREPSHQTFDTPEKTASLIALAHPVPPLMLLPTGTPTHSTFVPPAGQPFNPKGLLIPALLGGGIVAARRPGSSGDPGPLPPTTLPDPDPLPPTTLPDPDPLPPIVNAPEPTTLVLVASGFLVLLASSKRRRGGK